MKPIKREGWVAPNRDPLAQGLLSNEYPHPHPHRDAALPVSTAFVHCRTLELGTEHPVGSDAAPGLQNLEAGGRASNYSTGGVTTETPAATGTLIK